MNKYCKIQHPVRGLIPFKLYQFQEETVKALVDHRFTIILKSRQLGISTVTAAYVAWLALFHKDQNILIIATKQSTAANMLRKVKTIVKSAPSWLIMPQIVCDNKHALEFSHGSVVKAIPTSEDAGRSEALSLLIIDEAAHVQNFEDLWIGLQPTVSLGGRVIIVSTPNGVGNMFYRLWVDAEATLNEFNPIKLPWNVHPEHDQEWYENEARQLGSRRKAAQELDAEFIASSDTFLTLEDIEWVGQSVRPPIDRMGEDRSVWIWKYPEIGHRYLIAADVARGDAHDCSAFHVIDMDASDAVAEYKGRLPPDRFADLLSEVGRRYNDALVCPESNGFGYATLLRLRDVGYPRVYRQGSRAVYVVDYSPINDDIGQMGFNTSGPVRIRILSKLEEMIRNKSIRLHSSRLYEELKTFVWTGTRASALRGAHDDLVMSLAIGLWLYDASSGYCVHDVRLGQALVGSMETSTVTADAVLPGSTIAVAEKWKFIAPHLFRGIAISKDGSLTGFDNHASRRDQIDLSWLMK